MRIDAYPDDFRGAAPLAPGMLFIDATDDVDFNVHRPGHFQAEVAGQYSAMTGYELLIGRKTGTPMSRDYRAPFAFTGPMEMVTVELK